MTDQDPLQERLEQFLDHLSNERRLSAHTRSNYRRDLERVRAWCNENQIDQWTRLGPHQVRHFIAQRHRHGISGKSLQRELSSLRSLYRYLQREGIAENNPAQGIRAPKAPRKLPVTMDVDQLCSLLDVVTDDPLEQRDLAMMELLYSAGLRLAELVAVNLDDIGGDHAMLEVTGKGKKTRLVPVGRKALQAIAAWNQVRPQLADADEPALFVSRRGNRIHPRTVEQRLKRWAQKNGSGRNLYPHLFRHAFASHLLESSGDLRAVQELLGHADISTTQIYTHLDFQHLAQVYDSAHPRARKKRGGA